MKETVRREREARAARLVEPGPESPTICTHSFSIGIYTPRLCANPDSYSLDMWRSRLALDGIGLKYLRLVGETTFLALHCLGFRVYVP
jgi:hypothetical protein